MRVRVLGSGSSGNVLFVESGETRVLIDVGLSAKETVRRLVDCGIDPATIDGVVLTHEHSDHMRGVSVFVRNYDIPVYASPRTREACNFGGFEERMTFHDIESSGPFQIGALDFHPFTVPHDAVDSYAFAVESGGAKVALVTDLGYITRLVCDRVRGADVLILESNHDVEMLKICPQYPWSLKQRVLSKHGHLSNESVTKFLARDFDGKAEHLVLAHLSKNTNHPQLALLAARTGLEARGSLFFKDMDRRLSLADPDAPGPWINL
ncbi:MAG TPA: MBL fold metallo-hydrolase [Blastocatellia bacterium]|nr:MBL fold metallo-hydrolase [Blastocatellia bacterium]